MQAVRAVVQQAVTPMTVVQVAACFQLTRPEKVRPLLDTLTALALVRPTLEGTYAGQQMTSSLAVKSSSLQFRIRLFTGR
jgi:hypothetical protein